VLVAQYLNNRTQERFDTQTDPWGRAWLPSKRAQRQHGLTLVDTGRLRKSFAVNKPRGNVFFGQKSKVKYFAIHQWGGLIHIDNKDKEGNARKKTLYYKYNKDGTIKNQWVKRKKSNFAREFNFQPYDIRIPARPMLPIRGSDVVLPDDYRQDIEDLAKGWFDGLFS
jgi:phage gpG-like protein